MKTGLIDSGMQTPSTSSSAGACLVPSSIFPQVGNHGNELEDEKRTIYRCVHASKGSTLYLADLESVYRSTSIESLQQNLALI